MVTGLAERVEAVAGTPLPHGLLSLPTVAPMQDVHEQMGITLQPMSCGVAATTGWCPPDPGDEDREKVFNTMDSVTGPAVTAYAGVECATVGLTYAESVERARAILAVGEQAALESWAWLNVLADGDDVSGEPGDLSVVGRLSVLEAALATVYQGAGVVHVPVLLSAYMAAAGLLRESGSRLRTLTGHDVVIGAGYTGSEMRISGPVTVRQGTMEPGPFDEAGGISPHNDRRALAERTSVVAVECGVFVSEVELTCCGSSSNGS